MKNKTQVDLSICNLTFLSCKEKLKKGYVKILGKFLAKTQAKFLVQFFFFLVHSDTSVKRLNLFLMSQKAQIFNLISTHKAICLLQSKSKCFELNFSVFSHCYWQIKHSTAWKLLSIDQWNLKINAN